MNDCPNPSKSVFALGGRTDRREFIPGLAFAGPAGKAKTARDFEPPGTPAFPVRAAAGAALVFVEKVGLAEVEKRSRMLSDCLKAGLKTLPRVRLLCPAAAEVSSPAITLFEAEGKDALSVVDALLVRYRMHVDEHARDGLNAVRVSTHFYNSPAEVDRLLETVKTV